MSEAVAQQAAEQEPEIDLSLANKIIDKYIDIPGNLMPVLQGAQDEYGYIPRAVADLIAERLVLDCDDVRRVWEEECIHLDRDCGLRRLGGRGAVGGSDGDRVHARLGGRAGDLAGRGV